MSKDGVRGTVFGRSFSTLKTRLGLPAEITFHSFRHSVSTQLRNASADIREIWIDRLLGHEATHRSQGTSTYLSGITTANLKQTVEAIFYPDDIFRKGWSWREPAVLNGYPSSIWQGEGTSPVDPQNKRKK
ncbi:hypothetical protein GFGA_1c0798 [Gluconobacter frateurii NBRC 103465]|nr:hypothetical protein GFGA_1c0798 [Gluconobacter frateurii NBRC 103465]